MVSSAVCCLSFSLELVCSPGLHSVGTLVLVRIPGVPLLDVQSRPEVPSFESSKCVFSGLIVLVCADMSKGGDFRPSLFMRKQVLNLGCGRASSVLPTQ